MIGWNVRTLTRVRILLMFCVILFTAVLSPDRSAFSLPNWAQRGKVCCDKESFWMWVYSPEVLGKWHPHLCIPFCRWKGFWLSSLNLPPSIRWVLAPSEALWKASFWFQMVSSLCQQLRSERLLEHSFSPQSRQACSGHWARGFSSKPDMGGNHRQGREARSIDNPGRV